MDEKLREAFAELSRGRLEALAEVWNALARPMHNYAFALTGSQEEADDIVSEVMVRLAGRGWRLKAVREPKSYLFAAVRNEARTKAKRRKWVVEEVDDPPVEGVDEADAAVREAVMGLPVEQREVVVLHVWGGLTFEEVGRTVGVPTNTAASRYRYALEKLRTAMSDER
jgi:RNA polymerase sigma-70 factor (ECF subfamily)